MPYEVCLIRHGAAAASWAESLDPGLSPEGHAQAQAVAMEFSTRTACAVVSSPLARARQTAQPLATRWGLTVQIDDCMREIPSGVPMAERRAWLVAIMQSRWSTLDKGLLDWRRNAVQSALGYGGDTLVFTHFMVINALVAHATGDDRVVCFEPDYGSITRLRCAGDALSLVALGATRTTPILL